MGIYDGNRKSIETHASVSSCNGVSALNERRPEPTTTRRARPQQCPVPVEATVYWWRLDEIRSSHARNRFGLMPTTPVRFRCIGTLTAKYPQRYRVDLAQGLDWLPDLSTQELKELGASLAVAISYKLVPLQLETAGYIC